MQRTSKQLQIGKVLRRVRESRGFTQAAVAPLLGVSRSTVVQMENGNRAVRAEEIERLAGFYGCSVNELLTTQGASLDRHDEEDGLSQLFAVEPQLAEDVDDTFRSSLRLARALTEVEHRLSFPAIINVLPTYVPEAPISTWQAVRQGYRVSEDERRRLALGEGPIRFVDELLATVGVRAAKASLPRGMTSIFVNGASSGCLVVVNGHVGIGKRRLNYAHGLAHALFDRDLPWRVCRPDKDQDQREMRASAFASGLLLPEHGVRRYLETLGKETLGRSGPTVLSLFPEGEDLGEAGGALRVNGRSRQGRHAVRLPDLTRVAHYFGVSRTSTAHRLRNLRLLSGEQLDALQSLMSSEAGKESEQTLALPVQAYETDSLRSRLAALAAEAYCRGLIDVDKFNQIAATASVPRQDRDRLLAMSGYERATESGPG